MSITLGVGLGVPMGHDVGETGPPPSAIFWLMEDGVSYWLMEDGVSKWKLEVSV